jgi:polar amino acid transport system substrate-binding protein
MKRLCLNVLMLVFVVFFHSAAGLGQESEDKPKKFPTKTERKAKIVFSTASDSKTLHFLQQQFLYRELFKRLGYDFHLIHQPAKRSILDANSGKVDGDAARVFNLNKQNQYPNLIRVSEPILEMKLVAFSLDPSYVINGWESLNKNDYMVGYSHGYKIVESSLPKYLPKDRILIATNLEQGLKMLLAGRIDLFIDILGFEESIFLRSKEFSARNIHNAGTLESIITYPYLNKKHQDMVQNVKTTLQTMKRGGTYQKLLDQALHKFRQGRH